MATQPRQRSSSRTNNGAIIERLEQMQLQLTKLDARFDQMDARFGTLPDVFLPRREFAAEMSAFKEKQSDFHVRVTALEEWRLAQTQQAAATQLVTQQQVASAQIATQQQVANVATTQSDKRMALMQMALGTLSGAVVSLLVYILTYLVHH